jgi:hypothetical protein
LVAGIAGSIGSAAIQSRSASRASSAQARSADQQIAESRRQFDLVQGLLKPYVEAGSKGLQYQLDLMGMGGTAASEGVAGISAQDAQRTAIDNIANGEQFGALTRQGEYGLMANAGATGGLRGGDTARAMAEFRPAMLQSLIDKQLAQYAGLAANGQNAAAMTGTAAQNTGAQVNQALGDRGAAQAGNYLAQGQAWQNAGAGVINTMASMAQPMQPGGGMWQKWTF